MAARTQFINVDLDIVSASDLGPLARAMEPIAHALHCTQHDNGEWWLVLELFDPIGTEEAINAFLAAIEALPQELRGVWQTATSRCFDVGIEAVVGPAWATEVSSATLRRMADHGASFEITVYAHGDEAR